MKRTIALMDRSDNLVGTWIIPANEKLPDIVRWSGTDRHFQINPASLNAPSA